MKQKHKYLQMYVEAKLQEQMLSNQLEKILTVYNSENQIFGTIPPKYSTLLETLMLELIADRELMGWVDWWMYDCEHGTRHMDFNIDGRPYTVTELTFQQFLELVDA